MVKKRKLLSTPPRVKIEGKDERMGIGPDASDMAVLDISHAVLPGSSPGGDDVLNARHRLKGALQELLDQSDDSSISSSDDTAHSAVFSRQSPIKKEQPVTPPTQAVRNFRQQRKRRRREAVNEGAFHHTYVMKLFDRSVDLAQFKEDTPLYPVCRAWMANQPRNTNLVPKMRTPTPEPPPDDGIDGGGSSGGEADSEVVRDTYKMPAPEMLPVEPERHISPRIPSPVHQNREGIILDYDLKPPVPREILLQSHLTHWNVVRRKWHTTSNVNEARYAESSKILRAIYKKAQKAFE